MQNYPDCWSTLNSAGDPFTLQFSLRVHNQTPWHTEGLLETVDCQMHKHEAGLAKQD
jgi:hypothetical protein